MGQIIGLIFVICLSFGGCRSLVKESSNISDEKYTPLKNEKEMIFIADSTKLFRFIEPKELSDRDLGVFDIGNITSGEVVKGSFFLKNQYDDALVIESFNVSCGCLTFDYSSEPLKSGAIVKVSYSYNSSGKSGQQYTTIKISTSKGDFKLRADCLVK